MKLIDILVQELPKRGGWPEGAVECVRFVDEATIDFYDEHGNWPDDCSLTYGPIAKAICITPTEPCQRETVKFSEYEAALAASKPEWDGEGLPPSGVEFEYLRGNFGADEGRWVKCTMKYAGDKFCIVHLEGEGESWLKHEGTKIRPIRSEADKKRDEIAKAINSAVDASGTLGHMIYNAIAAGKIPHIRID